MSIKEKIVDWIVMLNSPDFKDTDAELVRSAMLNLINLEEDLKERKEQENRK